MTARSKPAMKALFETGDRPSQSDFGDLIDSYADFSTAGTVVSAGLVMPNYFAVAGSPITTSGNFVVTVSAQAQQQFLASPVSATGTPTFRTFALSDLPAQSVSAGSYANPTLSLNDRGLITAIAAGSSSVPVVGSFTPSFVGLSTAGSPVHTAQEGNYIKIGTLVMYEIHLTISAIGGMTGQLAINGLPFTVSGTLFAGTVGTYTNANAAITTAPRLVAQGGTTQIRMHKDGAGSSAVLSSSADITATFDIYIAGFYFT